MKKVLIYTLLSFNFLAQSAQAQDIGTFMQNDIWQSPFANPAFVGADSFKWHVQLGRVNNYALNSPTSLYNVSTPSGNKRIINLKQWADKTSLGSENNQLLNNQNYSVFALGYRHKNWNFGLGYSFRYNEVFNYTGDAVYLAANGNANLTDRPANLSFAAQVQLYHDVVANIAYQSTDKKWTIGANVHYLNGSASFSTDKGYAQLTTNGNDIYQLSLKTDLLVHTSGLGQILIDSNKVTLPKNTSIGVGLTGNHGLALDLGATYQISNKLKGYAGISNLGAITWKTNTFSYKSEDTFTFNGLDLSKIVKDSTFSLADTLLINIKPTTSQNTSYTTGLTFHLSAGVQYALSDKFDLHVLAQATKYKEIFRPEFAVGVMFKAYKGFSVGGNVSYKSNIVGLGLLANVSYKSLVFYASTDNAFQLLSPNTYFGARAGMYFRFHKDRAI